MNETETTPQPGDPGWEDSRENLQGPELIRAAEQAARRAFTIGIRPGPEQDLWQAIASYLNDAANIPLLTESRLRDRRAFSRAVQMSYAILDLLNARRVTRTQARAGQLPADAWGVRWTDNGNVHCRAHLTPVPDLGYRWVPDEPGAMDEPAGFILTGPLVCDQCAAEGRERV